MSELVKQLIEESLQTKDPYLDLGRCGLDGTEKVLERLEACVHLETLIFSNFWEEFDEVENKHLGKKSKNRGEDNHFVQVPKYLPSNLKKLILAGDWEHHSDIIKIEYLDKLQQLKVLDLSQNKIKKIENLDKLIQLQELNLHGNQITQVQDLHRLINLKTLCLSYNQITQIQGLGHLTKLNNLTLQGNKIKQIENLNKLLQLKKLDLHKNQIKKTTNLDKLTELENLNLSKNLIIQIENLDNLVQLKILDLGENNIKKIKGLNKLTQLVILQLQQNHIQDLQPLQNLVKLVKLELSSNQIKDLTPLKNLKLLNQFGIDNNPLIKDLPRNYQKSNSRFRSSLNKKKYKTPKIPIILQDALTITNSGVEILRYWLDTYTKTEKPVPVREAKVVFVGEGDVGKTSLIHLLLKGEKINHAQRTEKIEIHTDTTNFTYGTTNEPLTLRFWDFGGQDIMHATHKFFMSDQTLYVLVANGRKNDDEALENWIEMLKSSIGNSPVLLVANKLDDVKDTHQIADLELKRKFPNLILSVIETSWETGRGIDKLKETIQVELQKMPHFKEQFSPIYQSAKEKLEKLDKPYINFEEYEQICQEVAIEKDEEFGKGSQSVLADVLNYLGIMLNFRKLGGKLEDLYIFKPHWIVDGVYQIINSEESQKQKGKIQEKSITQLLKKIGYKSAQERDFITEMMKKFRLTYHQQSLNTSYYLIPSLFNKNRPQNLDKLWQQENTLCFRFRYKIWRNDYISYFLVSQHDKIIENQYWINGAILQYENHQVFIEAIRTEKTIQIEVMGNNDKRYALWQVRGALNKIHNMFDRNKLGIETWVVHQEGEKEDEFRYEDLLIMQDDRVEKLYSTKLRKHLIVKDLIEGVDPSITTSQKLVQYIQNADHVNYFAAMDKVVPDNLRNAFEQLNNAFILERYGANFSQQLAVFTQQVARFLERQR